VPGSLLHQGVTITCPHGGSATVTPANTRVSVGGNPVLLVDDASTVAGCAFNISGAPSPCMRVQWLAPATRVTVTGKPVLLSSSVGLCVNAGGVPQGPATVPGYQTQVSGQ
jgi:hypothetical protein